MARAVVTAGKGFEERFIDKVDAFDISARDGALALPALEDWRAQVTAELEGYMPSHAAGPAHLGLAQQLSNVHVALRRHMRSWPGQWAALQDASALADTFADRLLVLVFGKFNAGKSSLCNFIAERYRAHHRPVTWFRADAGRIVESTEGFREGGTETTVDVQGVRLGDRLLLVDTPGLHSISHGNASLTQRFTESADLLLWLTSSTSPGQVQELDALGRELHRRKPLLPVLTRSDVYEEDEVDGELTNALRNKTPPNRALQEADVRLRAEAKLRAMGVDLTLLRSPVSVSVLAAREKGSTSDALTEAGFGRFYDALLDAAQPALAYKRRKRAEVLLHHLDEVVLGAMGGEVRALLRALSDSARVALEELESKLGHVERAVWRRVMPTLPELLERHAATMDVNALAAAVSASMHAAFVEALEAHCSEYEVAPVTDDARVVLDADARYEAIAIDEGDALRDGSAGLGVSYERLYVALEAAMRAALQRLAGAASRRCQVAIEQSVNAGSALERVIDRHALDLSRLKQQLRSGDMEQPDRAT